MLGVDHEIPDLLHDVFVFAMTGIAKYRGDTASLRPWLTQIAVRAARKCIRRRTTRRMLGLRTPGELPDTPDAIDPEHQTALRRAEAALDRLPTDERIAFCLRYVEGMQLDEVAHACDTALATVKRRLTRARDRFETSAGTDDTSETSASDPTSGDDASATSTGSAEETGESTGTTNDDSSATTGDLCVA